MLRNFHDAQKIRKKIICISPSVQDGAPAKERGRAFREFFLFNNVEVHDFDTPKNLLGWLSIYIYAKQKRIKNIWVTMPPFRGWFLLLFPRLNMMIDIRDGWSIAMRSGYGGTAPKNKVKAAIAKIIEKIAISRAKQVYTCTPGLQKHFQSISYKNKGKVKLIRNSFSKEDQRLADKLRKNNKTIYRNSKKTYICAGKFSEYGKDKVSQVLNAISVDSKGKEVELHIIGACKQANNWLLDINDYKNVKIKLLDQMPKESLYRLLLQSHCGVTVIRDPAYDVGTKVYDYLVCDLPVLNYFRGKNEFVQFMEELGCSAGLLFLCKNRVKDRQQVIFDHQDDIIKSLD
jgi:hypothetical protein